MEEMKKHLRRQISCAEQDIADAESAMIRASSEIMDAAKRRDSAVAFKAECDKLLSAYPADEAAK